MRSIPWFRRHPAWALLAANAVVFAVLAGVAELFLRIYIPFNPGYYTSVSGTSRELVYAFGRIPINADGFPDEEFRLDRPHRVGYFGDSVTYGVGAGYGYRISELLEAAYPDHEHLNLGGIGLSVSRAEIAYSTRLARRYSLDRALYLMNLNDVVPDLAASGEQATPITEVQQHLLAHLDWLRGRSYVYTYLRHTAKSFLEAHGLGFHGYPAYELFPGRNADVLRQTAARVAALHRALRDAGTELTVVLLPYEMQISQEAESTYRALGVKWEDGFIDRGPQRILLESLPREIPALDAYFAFVDPDAVAESRARNRVGEYFVYNAGDKLDWNHPNRSGHRAIAEYLVREKVFGAPYESP